MDCNKHLVYLHIAITRQAIAALIGRYGLGVLDTSLRIFILEQLQIGGGYCHNILSHKEFGILFFRHTNSLP